MKIRKALCFILSLLLVAAIVPLTATAENGPYEGYFEEGDWKWYPSFGHFTQIDEEGFPIYDPETDSAVTVNFWSDGKVGEMFPGTNYDKETNTLTLNSIDAKDWNLDLNMMGEDFKIVVNGECHLGCVICWGDGWGGSLTVEGTGTLILNELKRNDASFIFYPEDAPGFFFKIGAKVTVEMNAGREGECLVAVYTVKDFDPSKDLVLGNATPKYEKTQDMYQDGVAGYLGEFDEEWCGYKCAVEGDPNGIYTYSTLYSYNEETDEYDIFSYISVQRYIYSETFGCYFPDHAYMSEYGDGYDIKFYSQEEFDDSIFTPCYDEYNEPIGLYLYQPCRMWSSYELLYKDAEGNGYIIGHDYETDTDIIYKTVKIPEVEDEYLFMPAEGVGTEDLEPVILLSDTYSYAVRGEHLTVSATFTDVPDGKWYTRAVLYCNEKGYMTGTSETTFAPNATLTRAMFVQILAKIADADLSGYTKDLNGLPFTDVKAGWYIKALKWAYENGYTSGLTATTFGPNNNVTRQELAKFLHTYATANEIAGAEPADITGYPDYSSVAKWAKDAVAWAVGNQLISGVKVGDVTNLDPKGNATRAQVALIVMNFVEKLVNVQ